MDFSKILITMTNLAASKIRRTCVARSLTNFVYQRTKRRLRWISKGFQVGPQGSIYSTAGSKLCEYIITEGFLSNRLDDVDTLTNYFHVFIRVAIVTCEMCQQRGLLSRSSYSLFIVGTLKMTMYLYVVSL